MRKRMLRVLFLLMIFFFPCRVLAYTDGDESVASSKVYNFLVDDINSEDIVNLYNPDQVIVPSYFNLNEYFYEKYNFHIPVADQKNLPLCDTFSSVKSVETNYALKAGKFLDISERYLDYMTSVDFLGTRNVGHICDSNGCNEGSGSSSFEMLAVIQSYGAPLEKEIPYVNYDEENINLIENSKSILKLNSVVTFPNIQNVENDDIRAEWIRILKIHIMKYGSIRAVVCNPKGDIYNYKTASLYQVDSCTGGGHGVSIVGWDDNYPKENFNTVPERNGAYIVLNSWGKSWGDNGYFYVSYDDINVLVDLMGVLDVIEAKNYNIYSKSSNMFSVNGFSITNVGLGRFTAMKFNRGKENEYLSHIAISASDNTKTNNSTKVRFYLNPIDDTFDKEKLIYLGEELPSLNGRVTIITLDEPIKITGTKFALVYEVTGDTSRFNYKAAVDRDGNKIGGFTYISQGLNQQWNIASNIYTAFPAFVFTIDGIVKSVSIKAEPSKKTYIKGESIDLSGGILNVTYEDDTVEEIDMTDSAVKLYDYDTDTLGVQEVSLLYEGNILKYDIVVKNEMDSIQINFNANGGSGSMNSITSTAGSLVTLSKNMFIKSGCSFGGWNTKNDGTGTFYSDEEEVSFNSNITLYAQWVPIKYSITFRPNGGSGTMDSISFTTGSTITLSKNKYTRDGYTFSGWNTRSSGTGTSYSDEEEVSFNSNITLYAQWVPIKYNVTFNPNGGIGTMDSISFTTGSTITLSKNKYTRDGYTFSGWNTRSSGTGTSYSDEEVVNLTSNLILYAIWSPISYEVWLNPNGGSGSIIKLNLTYDEEKKLPDNSFVRNGYIFKEWTTSSNGTGDKYSDGDNVINLTSLENEVVNLYASWSKKPIINNNTVDYSVYYDGNEHSISINVDVDNYNISYSSDGVNYNINSLPSFSDVGEYTIYYKITKDGYDSLSSSNKVKIYGIRSFDNSITVRNNILLIRNNSFSNISSKIVTYADSSLFSHYKNNSVISSDLISTGDVINIRLNNYKDYKYDFSVLGDINSDGKISSADYIKIKKHIMQTEIISKNIYFYAADINNDNKISSADYVRIRKYIMNGESL